MKHLTSIAAVLAAATILSLPAHADDHVSAWRLFVADHATPKLTVLDLETGNVLSEIATKGPASLYTSPTQAAVYAIQSNDNQVSVIKTGIALDDHGDHGDIALSGPTLFETPITGEYPVHFVAHGDEITLFFDKQGRAVTLDEHDFLEGKGTGPEYTAAAPHHGVATVFDDHILITEPNLADPDALPVGVNVIDRAGAKVGGLHACPDLHGEASSGSMLAIACATGLLLVEPGKDGPVIRHLPYDPTLPEGKSTTLLGGVGLQYFLGNFGSNRVALIDPSEASAFRLIDLPTRRVHFAVDPVRVKFAYVLTEDGNLHQINVISGAISKTLAVTEPYSMDGEWNLPRPRVAVAGNAILVTEPLAGRVRVIDAESFTLSRDIAVAGTPFGLVVAGGSGAAH
jgi:hypothetical protein